MRLSFKILAAKVSTPQPYHQIISQQKNVPTASEKPHLIRFMQEQQRLGIRS
jgi:hypothetical protein